jgi:hypothetical protein
VTDEGSDLEIHEPVDEVPGPAKQRRQSKWDVVVDRAVEHRGRWVPVTKPRTFTTTTATWLQSRTKGLQVETRAEKVYLKWDPEFEADVAGDDVETEPGGPEE